MSAAGPWSVKLAHHTKLAVLPGSLRGRVLFRQDHRPMAVMVYGEPLEAPWYTLYAEAMALDGGLMGWRWAAFTRGRKRRADDVDDAKVDCLLDGQGCGDGQTQLGTWHLSREGGPRPGMDRAGRGNSFNSLRGATGAGAAEERAVGPARPRWDANHAS